MVHRFSTRQLLFFVQADDLEFLGSGAAHFHKRRDETALQFGLEE